MVLDYLDGGELLQKIKEMEFTEQTAIRLSLNLIQALDYIHDKQVIHRDLKPENLLFSKKEGQIEDDLIIADFGLSTINEQGEKQKLGCGTPQYAAPEILNGKEYDQKVDVFSMGAIIYEILSGRSYSKDCNYLSTVKAKKKLELRFIGDIWKNISDKAKDFLGKVLEEDPNKRLSCKEALNHPWFKKDEINGFKRILKHEELKIEASKELS